MSEIKLKPCPFCGGEKLKIDSKRTFKHGGEKHCSVTVRCMKCHARSPVVGINMPKGKYNEREICEKAVIEVWNRRVDDDRPEAIREFVHKIKDLVKQKNYLLADIHNSKDFGMFTLGFEQVIDEIVKEMEEE